MGREKFVSILTDGLKLGEQAKSQRDRVCAELRALGEAYVQVLRDRFELSAEFDIAELPQLPSAVQAGFSDSNVFMLSLVVRAREIHRVNILTCSFEANGAYPCVITAGEFSVVCKTFRSVQAALVKVCGSRGLYISNEIARIKTCMSAPSSNDGENDAPVSNEANSACVNATS